MACVPGSPSSVVETRKRRGGSPASTCPAPSHPGGEETGPKLTSKHRSPSTSPSHRASRAGLVGSTASVDELLRTGTVWAEIAVVPQQFPAARAACARARGPARIFVRRSGPDHADMDPASTRASTEAADSRMCSTSRRQKTRKQSGPDQPASTGTLPPDTTPTLAPASTGSTKRSARLSDTDSDHHRRGPQCRPGRRFLCYPPTRYGVAGVVSGQRSPTAGQPDSRTAGQPPQDLLPGRADCRCLERTSGDARPSLWSDYCIIFLDLCSGHLQDDDDQNDNDQYADDGTDDATIHVPLLLTVPDGKLRAPR